MLTVPFEDVDATCEPAFGGGFPRADVHDTTSQSPAAARSSRSRETEDEDGASGREEGGASDEEREDQGPSKRRGGRGANAPAGRPARVRVRRQEANARERSRMHGLNDALESLRRVVPCYSTTQKLSKIETLRLAKNYIWALGETLSAGRSPDRLALLHTLCRGLSQPTANLLAGCLQIGAVPPGSAGYSPVAPSYQPRSMFPWTEMCATPCPPAGTPDGGPPLPPYGYCGAYRTGHEGGGMGCGSPRGDPSLSPRRDLSGIIPAESSVGYGSVPPGLDPHTGYSLAPHRAHGPPYPPLHHPHAGLHQE